MKIAIVSNREEWIRKLEREMELCRETVQPIEVVYLRDTRQLCRAAMEAKFDLVWICGEPGQLSFADFFAAANRVWESLSLSRRCINWRFGRTTIALSEGEIRFIRSEKRQVSVCTRRQCFRISTTMKEAEERMKRYGFIRIHRNTLVNPRFVRAVEPGCVVLRDGTRLEISTRRETQVRALLQPRNDSEPCFSRSAGGRRSRELLS